MKERIREHECTMWRGGEGHGEIMWGADTLMSIGKKIVNINPSKIEGG